MPERRKCYISYKREDEEYKKKIIEKLGDKFFIDRSQDEWIDSEDEDYIMQCIRDNWLKDTTVTIFLIGEYSHENHRLTEDWIKGYDTQRFIRREIKSSLYDGKNNTRNGLLGIVLPTVRDKVYKGSGYCETCKCSINIVNINDSTTIKEFNQNYYLRKPKACDHYSSSDRYAVVADYYDFMNEPDKYIEEAFDKRNSEISNYVKVKKFD